GAEKVSAYDLDEVAVSSTNINKKLNGINEEVIAAKNNLLDGITQEADVIVANILAEIIVDLIEDAERIIKKDGYLVLSGIIDKKSNLVKEKLAIHNFSFTKFDFLSIIPESTK